jgi:hypothetical protein
VDANETFQDQDVDTLTEDATTAEEWPTWTANQTRVRV